jgi:iron uptake system component EfeO
VVRALATRLAPSPRQSSAACWCLAQPYRQGEGFASYTELSKADTRKLAQQIDALAEELSQVPALIVG